MNYTIEQHKQLNGGQGFNASPSSYNTENISHLYLYKKKDTPYIRLQVNSAKFRIIISVYRTMYYNY